MALDSVEAARELSEIATACQVRYAVLVEVDVGLGRVGVTHGEDLLRFVEFVAGLETLDFDGVAFFPGHIRKLDEKGEMQIQTLARLLQSMLSRYCTVVYSQTRSYEETARRLGIDRRTVKSKIDAALLERLGGAGFSRQRASVRPKLRT